VKSISHTTRTKRAGEKNKEDYFFVDANKFDQMVSTKKFIEYAEVFGNFYGTSKTSVDRHQDEGRDVLLEIDWQGAHQIQKTNQEAVSIFIVPPGKKELETRLVERDEDSEETITRRLSQAEEDMKKARAYDYVVVNDLFEQAASNLLAIIEAERLKTSNQIINNELVRDLLSLK
jgi:guanylate kinase